MTLSKLWHSKVMANEAEAAGIPKNWHKIDEPY